MTPQERHRVKQRMVGTLLFLLVCLSPGRADELSTYRKAVTILRHHEGNVAKVVQAFQQKPTPALLKQAEELLIVSNDDESAFYELVIPLKKPKRPEIQETLISLMRSQKSRFTNALLGCGANFRLQSPTQAFPSGPLDAGTNFWDTALGTQLPGTDAPQLAKELPKLKKVVESEDVHSRALWQKVERFLPAK